MPDSLKSFLKIVELDTQITRYVVDKASFEKQIQEITEKINGLKSEMEIDKKTVLNSQIKCSNIELEIKSLDDKIRKIKKQLDAIANLKEYNSIQKELLDLEKEKLLKDDILLAYWDETAKQTEEIKDSNKRKDLELHNLQIKAYEYESRIQDLIRRIKECKDEKLAFKDHASIEYLQEYQQMLSVINNPAVPVMQKACSGCFYSLTNTHISQLNDKKIIKCNHCHRFLYSLETF